MSILARAELLLQAKNYSGSGDWLDESGNGHDAKFGTGVPGTNDPQSLPWTGENYVCLPQVAGNYASTPHSAGLLVTDVDIRVDLSVSDWTPISSGCLMAKRHSAIAAHTAFQLNLNAGGKLEMRVGDGSVYPSALSTVATGLTDGTRNQIRCAVDIDNGAGGVDFAFYTRDSGTDLTDNTGWTLLGTVVTNAGSGALASLADVNTPLQVGAAFSGGTSAPLLGSIYQAVALSGIDGTLAFDMNLDDAAEPFATFTERSANAATVTINRSGSGLYVVDQPAFGLHTDDYFEIADHADLDFADSEDFTLLAVFREATYAANAILVSKRNGSGPGYQVYTGAGPTPRIAIEDTTSAGTSDTGLAFATRTTVVAAVRRDDTTPELEVFTDGVGSGSPSTAGLADLSNAIAFSIGATETPAAFIDSEVMAVALFREALTDDEIVAAGEALLYGETAATWVLLGRRPAVHVGARR